MDGEPADGVGCFSHGFGQRRVRPDHMRELLRCRLEASVSDEDPTQCSIQRSCPDSGFERGLSRDQLDAIGWEFVPATRSLHRELGGSQTGVIRSLMQRIDLGDDLDAIQTALAELAELLDSSAPVAEFRRVS